MLTKYLTECLHCVVNSDDELSLFLEVLLIEFVFGNTVGWSLSQRADLLQWLNDNRNWIVTDWMEVFLKPFFKQLNCASLPNFNAPISMRKVLSKWHLSFKKPAI